LDFVKRAGIDRVAIGIQTDSVRPVE
jgi:hypothetical protein